jgi:hypothetical protein
MNAIDNAVKNELTPEQWGEKLAANVSSDVQSWPQAFSAMTTLEDALRMVNRALIALVIDPAGNPRMKKESWEYATASKRIYNAVKWTLQEYDYAYLPDGLTIGLGTGKQKGIFVAKKTAKRANILEQIDSAVAESKTVAADNAKPVDKLITPPEYVDKNALIIKLEQQVAFYKKEANLFHATCYDRANTIKALREQASKQAVELQAIHATLVNAVRRARELEAENAKFQHLIEGAKAAKAAKAAKVTKAAKAA